jgi:hypothetical protein
VLDRRRDHWERAKLLRFALGMLVQFQPYEVTAYAYGAPTVTIPWTALSRYLAVSGNEIVYGY